MIQVSNLVHRLGDRHSENAIAGLELLGRDGDGLVAIGLTVDSRGNQVAEPAAAEEVADANEPLTVPREKDRATAGLAIVLGEVEFLVAGDVQLALHDSVWPKEVDQVGPWLISEAQHDRNDRLAQAGFGCRVVVSGVDPLPFDDHAGPECVRVGPHEFGLHAPVPAELERQPMLSIAQVPGESGWFAGRDHQDVGQWIADQVDRRQTLETRGLQPQRECLCRVPLPFVARPRREGEVARFARRGRQSQQVGPPVKIEINGLCDPPSGRIDRPGLEGQLGLLRCGPDGRVAPDENTSFSAGRDQIDSAVGVEIA